MKVTICRCYYDLANLYGDNGNISVLRDYLREQGAEVVIEKPTVGDPMNFDEYDFIYIGSMTEGNFAIVAEDFAGKAEQLKRVVENGKRVLLTGNAGELLGQTIIVNGRETEGSGILGFTVSPLASRHMGEIILKDATVKRGKLCYGPKEYGTLFIVEVSGTTPETVAKIEEFVKQGGRVFCIGKYPDKSLGLQDYEARDREIVAAVDRLKAYPDNFILLEKPEDGKYVEWYEGVMER